MCGRFEQMFEYAIWAKLDSTVFEHLGEAYAAGWRTRPDVPSYRAHLYLPLDATEAAKFFEEGYPGGVMPEWITVIPCISIRNLAIVLRRRDEFDKLLRETEED
jgi:hypothetical protein